ncbi:MAG: hypothetical protein LUG61_10560 [Lachnospiraceae bacterium]|nr:hypothetical protein [Lachnospiraceae bacterium]
MKKWIRGLAFVCVLTLVLGRTYAILSWKETYGEYHSCIRQLYNTGDDLMDVVFVGTSHVFDGVNPAILWEEYGISGFVMGGSAQGRELSYHYIIEMLKTQSPKVVFVDLYGLVNEMNPGADIYRGTLSMKLSFNSIRLTQEIVDTKEEQLQHILRWPIIHTRYREIEERNFVEIEYNTYGRGYDAQWWRDMSVHMSEELLSDTVQADLGEEKMEWLQNLADLATEEGFELIFTIMPYYFEDNADIWESYNTAKAFAAQNEIVFLDLNVLADEVGIDFEQDFRDSTHLNAWGAQKVSSYLGAFLKEHVELEDHRGDDAYYLWDLNLEYYLSELAQNDPSAQIGSTE